MKLFILIFFTFAGMAIGGYQFRSFPWREKPSAVRRLLTILMHLAVGAGIGLFMGGWLAGQLEQMF